MSIETSVEIRGLSVNYKTGSEGPRHDPYAFTEVTFDFFGTSFKIHLGLAEYISINGEETRGYENVDDIMTTFFRFPFSDFMEEIEAAIHNPTCPNCGSSRISERPGFPGESFMVCEDCEEILTSLFNREAIM